ncbi:Hypothetical protein POVN_LOCUS645 [uncultured virus]|nr:Hypothetical protein POVN_LOCUS645 [uncultured virus]
MSSRILVGVDDLHFDGINHLAYKELVEGDVEVVAEGSIPIMTLYRALGLPLPKVEASEKSCDTRVRFYKMWLTLKALVTTTERKQREPVSSVDDGVDFEYKSVVPVLLPLDKEIVEKFKRLNSDEVETPPQPTRTLHPSGVGSGFKIPPPPVWNTNVELVGRQSYSHAVKNGLVLHQTPLVEDDVVFSGVPGVRAPLHIKVSDELPLPTEDEDVVLFRKDALRPIGPEGTSSFRKGGIQALPLRREEDVLTPSFRKEDTGVSSFRRVGDAEASSSFRKDGLQPIVPESPRQPPPGFGYPVMMDPLLVKPHLLRQYLVDHLKNTTQLEGRSLQAFTNQVIHSEAALAEHKSPALSHQAIRMVQELARKGICKLSPDGTRFSIEIPTLLDRASLPSIDRATMTEIWAQMGHQFAGITKFHACVNAVTNSYSKWKLFHNKDQLATAVVVKLVEAGLI